MNIGDIRVASCFKHGGNWWMRVTTEDLVKTNRENRASVTAVQLTGATAGVLGFFYPHTSVEEGISLGFMGG